MTSELFFPCESSLWDRAVTEQSQHILLGDSLVVRNAQACVQLASAAAVLGTLALALPQDLTGSADSADTVITPV